jgi:hypothetical protein
MEIPKRLNDIGALIDRAHESRKERPRGHLGCSGLGHDCERWIWLSFRWAVRKPFSGRILRLFRRGHLEEAQIIQDLKMIGIKIGGDQTRVDFGCHISGSVDGIIESGVPQAPNKQHVAEFKTHSKKSFDDLVKNGVEKSKPIHYAQMQLYMYGLDIDRALYVAICKDDDTYYIERVKLDDKAAQKLLDKGKRLALEERLPPPISTDPSWYQCKFCDAHEFCHETKLTKEVNCRTCAHSTPKEDSTFYCERWRDTIPYKAQVDGCPAHTLHPDLVPWDLVPDESEDFVAVYDVDGKRIKNGENHFASSELIAGKELCADPMVQAIRDKFDGRITDGQKL